MVKGWYSLSSSKPVVVGRVVETRHKFVATQAYAYWNAAITDNSESSLQVHFHLVGPEASYIFVLDVTRVGKPVCQ